MENQFFAYLLIVMLIGLILGFWIGMYRTRKEMAAAINAAQEQGRSSSAMEIATLSERVRMQDADRARTEREHATLNAALEIARNENTKLSERASQAQALDAQLGKLQEKHLLAQQEILRLSTNEAEKSQALQDTSASLMQTKEALAKNERQLNELQQLAAGLREESGRLNAELKAAHEALSVGAEALNQERTLRLNTDEISVKLAADLAESNKQRAVFEADASRIPTIEAKILGAERALAEAQKQAADLREDSGRINAELKAKCDENIATNETLQQELTLRRNAEELSAKLASDLAESNKQCAVFEADASRIPTIEAKIIETERTLTEVQKQAADLREVSGRINAELKAKCEENIAANETLQQERTHRLNVEELSAKLASDLAESNKQRAVFEADASRIPAIEEKIRENERLISEVQKQAADLREVSGRANAELKAERDSLSSLRIDWQTEKNKRELAEASANSLTTALAEANGQLNAERSQAEEKLALLLEAKETLTNQFKSIANDIMEEKSKKFTEQNQTNIGQLLDPLRTKLHEFQGKVEEVYVQEGKDRTALAEQVRQLMDLNQVLSQDAKNLTSALKGSSKTQGNWGELILERVLEASGLRKGHEYTVQESHTREDGTRAQPDVVVHLPEERHLIVDAKVSLVAYEACVAADDDSARQVAIKRHLESVRSHMKGLSERNYQNLYGLKSLDFVLMFIPIEPAFMVAITHDQDLYMEALNKNVLLVSPSTLLFVVRTVAHLWRQEAQSKNAQEIAKRGAELYDRLSAFVSDLEKVGERLRQTQESYTEARNKLYTNKGNVIRQAEMLKTLGVKPTKTIASTIIDMASSDKGEDDAGNDIATIGYETQLIG